MKRKLFLFPFFLLTLFYFSFRFTQTAHAVSYTEQTIKHYAAALDAARKWDDCIPDDLPPIDSSGVTSGEGYGAFSFDTLGYTTISKTIFVGSTNCKQPERLQQLFNASFLGSTTKMIASLYSNPPASSVYYAYDLLQNGGFVKKTYAQGIGFPGLSPILPIWKAFRNISYIILVIILVAVGFMIMFRMKINPQTVISIQEALPRIIATLILITFSYAIAGLMIDLMYFVIMLLISIFAQAKLITGTGDTASQLQGYFLNANLGSLFNQVVWEEAVVGIPANIFSSGVGLVPTLFNSWGGEHLLQQATLGILGGTLGAVVGVVGGAITSVIMLVLIAIALLFIFVRIFLILLNSYIQIVLAVIMAPFQLLLGAVPGQNSFRNWLFGLIGNLAVFPTAIAIFLLQSSIAQLSLGEAVHPQGNLWVAPFLTGPTSDAGFIIGLFGLGLLMLTPSILNAVKAAFAAKPILPITPGMIVQPILGAGQTSMSVLMMRSYAAQAIQGFAKEGTIWQRIFGAGASGK